MARTVRSIAAPLVIGLPLGACGSSRPALISDLVALPVLATDVEATFLDNPNLDRSDWWEVEYTTASPAETVAAVRDLLIGMGSGPIDDANTGYGFTVLDEVDVHEVFTTDPATTKIVVRIHSSIVDGYRHIDG